MTGLEHTSYHCKLFKATPGLRRERRHWLVGAWLSWQDGKWVFEHALSLQETQGGWETAAGKTAGGHSE